MELIEAVRMANNLLDYHLKPDLDNDWCIEIDEAKRRAGYTSYVKKIISLSRTLTEQGTEERVLNTILHEIAHALVGSRHGHNRVWRAKAKSIGCDGKRNHSQVIQDYTWIAECPNCKRSYGCFRRVRVSCSVCDQVFNPDYLITYKKR